MRSLIWIIFTNICNRKQILLFRLAPPWCAFVGALGIGLSLYVLIKMWNTFIIAKLSVLAISAYYNYYIHISAFCIGQQNRCSCSRNNNFSNAWYTLSIVIIILLIVPFLGVYRNHKGNTLFESNPCSPSYFVESQYHTIIVHRLIFNETRTTVVTLYRLDQLESFLSEKKWKQQS